MKGCPLVGDVDETGRDGMGRDMPAAKPSMQTPAPAYASLRQLASNSLEQSQTVSNSPRGQWGPFQGVNRALLNRRFLKIFLGQEILKNDPKMLSRLSGSIKTEIPMSKHPRK